MKLDDTNEGMIGALCVIAAWGGHTTKGCLTPEQRELLERAEGLVSMVADFALQEWLETKSKSHPKDCLCDRCYGRRVGLSKSKWKTNERR